MGAKAEGIIAAIQDQIVNKGPHGLNPSLPSKEVAPVDMCAKLSEPPSYTKGQAVSFFKSQAYDCKIGSERGNK